MRLTTYTENQKIEAVKLWLVVGNLTHTAAALKIPYETLKTWRYSDWWEKLAVEIKAEGRIELSAKLKKIAEKALEATLDRIENGDWQMSPTGELVRRPVAAAVVSKIATDAISKAEELERVPETTSLQSVNDRLKSLAQNFESFSKKVRKVEVIDVEDNYAVHDQRETGLQEGATVGENQGNPPREGPSSPGSSPPGGGEDDGKPS